MGDPLKTKDIPAIDTTLSGFKAANISWSVARDCTTSRTETATEIVFDGDIEVKQVETLNAIRGTAVTRDVMTGMAYEVRFPKEITLTSGQVQVFSPILVIAAVTEQDFQSDTTQGTAQLFTSVQWPFMLTSATINSTNNATVAITNSSNNCPADAACETTFDFSLDPNSCSLTGDYQLSFTFQCNPLYTGSDCPLQGEAGNVLFTLTSGDLCAVFAENVDLTGSLISYLNDYTTARDAFIINQASYWQAKVSSTKVSIVNSEILAASTIFNSGAEIDLYSGGANTAEGTAAGFTLDGDGGDGTQSRFYLNMVSSLFPVPADQFLPAVMKCKVAATYSNTAKRQVKRYGELRVRLVYPSTKQGDLDTEAQVGLQGLPTVEDNTPQNEPVKPEGEESPSSGGTPAWPIALASVLLCCGLFAGIAGIVWYRRRQQEEVHDMPERARSNSINTLGSVKTETPMMA